MAAKKETEVLSDKEVQEIFVSEKHKQDQLPKVKMFIPEDPINPDKFRFVGINGVNYWLEVGTEIEVPECVLEVYNDSYVRTQKAKAQITTNTEIQ